MKKIRIHFKENWLKYVILLVIGMVVCASIILIKGHSFVDICDAFFVSGAILLAIGIFSFLSFLGAFDMFSYSFNYVMESKSKERKYASMNDYLEQTRPVKALRKYNFVPYVVVASLYLVVAVVLLALL